MLPKILIIVTLLVILYMLGSAAWFLLRDRGSGKAAVRRLTWRIGLSLVLFTLILLAVAAGWVKPSGPGPVRYPAPEQSTPGG